MEKNFTMEEIEKTFRNYKVNELAEGIVVAKKSDGVIFNLGGKLDAYIPKEECVDFDNIKIGDRFKVVIINKGKGINDMSPVVAMSTINEILNLKDKEEAVKILDDTINMHSDESVKENARSVKSLLALS